MGITLDQLSKVLYSLFLLYAKLRDNELYQNQAAERLLLPHIKFFQKTKTGLQLVSLSHFLHYLWRKTFFLLYSINWPIFIFWLSLLRQILGKMCIVIFYLPGCDIINFQINLIFLIKPFSMHDKNFKTEI